MKHKIMIDKNGLCWIAVAIWVAVCAWFITIDRNHSKSVEQKVAKLNAEFETQSDTLYVVNAHKSRHGNNTVIYAVDKNGNTHRIVDKRFAQSGDTVVGHRIMPNNGRDTLWVLTGNLSRRAQYIR